MLDPFGEYFLDHLLFCHLLKLGHYRISIKAYFFTVSSFNPLRDPTIVRLDKGIQIEPLNPTPF